MISVEHQYSHRKKGTFRKEAGLLNDKLREYS